jgi:tripartite-type tricarboxylate transporter receptor subunit TctC
MTKEGHWGETLFAASVAASHGTVAGRSAAPPGTGDAPMVSLRFRPTSTKRPREKRMMLKQRAAIHRRIGWMLPALALALSAGFVATARAQDYPTRTVKIIVPFPAGGTADVMPRILADWLSRKWGQAVIIENRAGAGGNVGAEVVAKSDPDGYTLLAAPPPPIVINQNLYPHLDFDPLQFVPVTVMGRVPNGLIVNPDRITANTVKDFIAYANTNPGKVTDATQGNGTTSHLTAELFQMVAKVKLQNVPYRGSGPALNDLVAGSVDCAFDNIGASMQLIKAGKLKLIAVATPERIKTLPDVPTIAETLPGFASVTWFAIVAPPKTPAAIADKISAGVNEALRDPEIQKRFADLTAEPVGGTPQATAAYFHDEVERWKNVITSAHVTLD